jgi:predicted Zn-dependent protease
MSVQRRLLVAAMLVLAACAARKPGEPIKPGYNMYSPEQDVEIGKQASAEIRQQVDIVKDADLQRYVSELGAKIASQPDAGGYPYTFTLINDPTINAFALPGGPIFVNSGLIEQAENEAQAMGVLAHEVAHVVLRHGTSQASKATLMQIPAVLAGVALADQNGAVQQLGQLGVSMGLNMLMMKYSRRAEKQADALGAKLLSQAGYNPVEMARFFEKLEGEGGERPPAILSSHPSPGNRVKLVEEELAALPQADYTAVSGQFAKMQNLVARLPESKPPMQTAARQTAPPDAPRRGFREYSDGRIQFAYPDGWDLFGDRNSNVITIAPQDGLVRTQSGGTAIGYGAVMSVYRPQSARGLESATRELFGQLQSVNSGLQATGQQRGQVSGRAALLTRVVGRSPYGGREMNHLLTVAQPDGLFYMVFVTPEEGARQLQGTFEAMLSSIQFAQ